MQKYIAVIILLLVSYCLFITQNDSIAKTNFIYRKHYNISKNDNAEVAEMCDTMAYNLWFGNDSDTLTNGDILYYKYDCNDFFLIKKSPKSVDTLFFMSSGLHPRLAYIFIKELKKHLLFRAGCSGNGPCYYILMDKITLKEKKVFEELIYTGETDSNTCIMYFNKNIDKIIVHNLNNNKKKKIDIIESRFTDVIPEYQFYEKTFYNDIITLKYFYMIDEKSYDDSLSINIKSIQ